MPLAARELTTVSKSAKSGCCIPSLFHVELSARVNRNIDAEYLTERGVVQNPDGSITITPRRGAAHVLGIHLGIWVGPNVLWSDR